MNAVKHRRLTSLALILAAAALIAAGCGDDDGGSTDGAETAADEAAPTKQEFIAEADQICAEGDMRLNEEAQEQFGTEGEPPPRDEQEAFISEFVAPELQAQYDAISELTPPEGDEEQIDELLAALQELADLAADDPATLLQAQGSEAARLAGEYGFTVCGG